MLDYKQGDTITYKGVATDGPKVATPYTRNITIVLAPDRTTAWTTYNSTISQQEARGYQKFMAYNAEGDTFWTGYLGGSQVTYRHRKSETTCTTRLLLNEYLKPCDAWFW